MKRSRRNHSPEFKARIGLEALKGLKTVDEIARAANKVHPTQVSHWKREVREKLPEVFAAGQGPADTGMERLVEELYAKVGKLSFELEWLRKKSEKLGL
jgi:transposase-like protein